MYYYGVHSRYENCFANCFNYEEKLLENIWKHVENKIVNWRTL